MAPKSDKGKAKKKGGTYSYEEPKKELTKFTFAQIRAMTNDLNDKFDGGQYGSVYKGTWNSEPVAVKLYEETHDVLAKNELQAYKDLQGYPNIVPLKGYCFDTNFCFVMDHIPGGNLETLLDGGKLNWEDTLKILAQLAQAIKGIIQENFVVGDMKPDSVLLDKDYNVYVCDFGSATKYGKGIPSLNKSYAAVEAINGIPSPEKTDIFSFGTILLQMITKCNTIGEVDRKSTSEAKNSSTGKRKKKEKNTSNSSIPSHISLEVRSQLEKKERVVHKSLLRTGCDEDDEREITILGINCTSNRPENRPTIDEIISILERMREKKPMSKSKMKQAMW